VVRGATNSAPCTVVRMRVLRALALSALLTASAVARAQPAAPNLRALGVTSDPTAVEGGALSVRATFSAEPGAAPEPFT
jgi:hypothetical protein